MADDDEVIDLGEWPDLPGEGPTEKKGRKVEDVRATLAFVLVGLLGAALAGSLLLLAFDRVDPEHFAQVAGVVVSPLVGLVGAVTGYYYGRSDRT